MELVPTRWAREGSTGRVCVAADSPLGWKLPGMGIYLLSGRLAWVTGLRATEVSSALVGPTSKQVSGDKGCPQTHQDSSTKKEVLGGT